MKKPVLFLLCLVAPMWRLPALAGSGEPPKPPDAELIRLERAKWGDPPGALTPEAFQALYAQDFVSVEYGGDMPPTGVVRRTRDEVFSRPPLPPAKFEFSEWRAISASPGVVVSSYRVTGVSFPWKAYATSVWALRGGKWLTVFYQASTAR
jgi:hypothetical protein